MSETEQQRAPVRVAKYVAVTYESEESALAALAKSVRLYREVALIQPSIEAGYQRTQQSGVMLKCVI